MLWLYRWPEQNWEHQSFLHLLESPIVHVQISMTFLLYPVINVLTEVKNHSFVGIRGNTWSQVAVINLKSTMMLSRFGWFINAWIWVSVSTYVSLLLFGKRQYTPTTFLPLLNPCVVYNWLALARFSAIMTFGQTWVNCASLLMNGWIISFCLWSGFGGWLGTTRALVSFLIFNAALDHVSEMITKSLNIPEATRAIAHDISRYKTFDRNWLLHKLKTYGVTGEVFPLFSVVKDLKYC